MTRDESDHWAFIGAVVCAALLIVAVLRLWG